MKYPTDFIFQEVNCHKQCFKKYMNSLRSRTDMEQSRLTCEKIAFPEFVSYIVGKLETDEVDFVFMTSNLTRIYDDNVNLLLSVKCYDYVI